MTTLARPLVEATKRKPLSRKEIGQLLIRQDCRCACGCKERLIPETMIDEHLKPLAEGGTNDLENRAFYNLECAKSKTKCDINRIRKAERMAGRRGSQWNRRKTNGPTLKTSSKLKGRGFQKDLTRGFDGKVRKRK